MYRFLLLGFAFVAVLVAAAAYGWHWMTGPMYQPGDVRAGKFVTEPLTPAPIVNDRWLVAPGIELHHFEEGTGTPILVVHGGPGFAPTRPWRAGSLLASDYRLVYYHQRGCGLSSRPIRSFPSSNMYANMGALHRTLGLPAQVADIERIRRILGVEKLILLGHSFGADIAAFYAAEFPEHVHALIYVAPADLAVLPNKQGDLFELVRQRLPAEMKPEYESYLAEYFDFGRALRRSDAESSAFYGRFGRFYAAAVGGPAPVSSDATTSGYVPLAVFCSMGKHHDYTSALHGVRTPSLVIHGSRDLQPETVSRNFAAHFPNCRFVKIEGATHFAFDDRPEEFAGEVRAFLSSVE